MNAQQACVAVVDPGPCDSSSHAALGGIELADLDEIERAPHLKNPESTTYRGPESIFICVYMRLVFLEEFCPWSTLFVEHTGWDVYEAKVRLLLTNTANQIIGPLHLRPHLSRNRLR